MLFTNYSQLFHVRSLVTPRHITGKRIRRGAFTSVAELEAAINEYNAKPKPFIWTAKASDILAKVTRARAALNKNTYNWRTKLGYIGAGRGAWILPRRPCLAGRQAGCASWQCIGWIKRSGSTRYCLAEFRKADPSLRSG